MRAHALGPRFLESCGPKPSFWKFFDSAAVFFKEFVWSSGEACIGLASLDRHYNMSGKLSCVHT